jgi:hypothetical protein
VPGARRKEGRNVMLDAMRFAAVYINPMSEFYT